MRIILKLSILWLSFSFLNGCVASRPDNGLSRSGVQVYGEIDTGYGYTKQTISGDGFKRSSTRSGVRQ